MNCEASCDDSIVENMFCDSIEDLILPPTGCQQRQWSVDNATSGSRGSICSLFENNNQQCVTKLCEVWLILTTKKCF